MVNKYVENTPNMVFGILTLNWVDESSPCSRGSYLHIDKVKMQKSSNREKNTFKDANCWKLQGNQQKN